ncbi:MAG: SDR family oxidoreductase [Bacteroidota bacterium]
MNIQLSNKNALVCGSSAGIGKASAILLAQSGANVTLFARNEDKLKDVLAQLDTTKGQKHDYIVADFFNAASVENAIQDSLQKTAKAYHILINNTGGPAAGLAIDAKEADFIQAFNNHLICNHILVKALVPGMKQNQYGRIINIISTSVKAPLHGLGVSNTIRGAVASWAKTLANELGQFNITVNNVLPGATATERLEAIINNKSTKANKSVDEISTEMINEVPMKRFAEANEIAQAVCFLASDMASYINGINLPVDGGRTASL